MFTCKYVETAAAAAMLRSSYTQCMCMVVSISRQQLCFHVSDVIHEHITMNIKTRYDNMTADELCAARVSRCE